MKCYAVLVDNKGQEVSARRTVLISFEYKRNSAILDMSNGVKLEAKVPGIARIKIFALANDELIMTCDEVTLKVGDTCSLVAVPSERQYREALEAMYGEFGSNFPSGERWAVDAARDALGIPQTDSKD